MENDDWFGAYNVYYEDALTRLAGEAVRDRIKNSRAVKTTKTSTFEDGTGDYFVMGPTTRRTFVPEDEAVVHAQNLIDKGNANGFYIVKVVGFVERAVTPVTYERFEN